MKRVLIAICALSGVVGGVLAAPPALAAPSTPVLVSVSTDCSAPHPLIVHVTNSGAETSRIAVDIDSDGDGVPDFGDGPPFEPGETIDFGYDVADGAYGVRVSTESGVAYDETVIVDCVAPVEATVTTDCTAAYPVTVSVTNPGSEPVRVHIDVDQDGDGVPDFGDGPLVDPSQTLGLGYDLADGDYAFYISTDTEDVLEQAVTVACDSGSPSTGIVFTDVSGHSFEKEIAWLAAAGISRGWQLGSNTFEFRPQQQILRGEMAAFLYRLAGQPAFTPPTASPFVDVSTSHTFYKEIAWLAQTGISRGWETFRGIEFRGEWPTSRDVMAAFLHRYRGTPAYSATGDSPFTDVQPATVFSNEIRWLASEGVTTGWEVGYGCREYRPGQNVLRSEMAAFLYRLENGGVAPVTANSCAPPPSPLVGGSVTPGAFCGAQVSGWFGYAAGGILMQCKASATDSRLRWRAV